MNETITTMLQTLAEKLGTTVEYLWIVLVAAQRSQGILLALESLIVLAVGGFFGHKLVNNSDDDDGISAVGYILYVVAIAISIPLLHYATLRLTNPEYAALQEILRLLN